jgi:hypothetical protein
MAGKYEPKLMSRMKLPSLMSISEWLRWSAGHQEGEGAPGGTQGGRVSVALLVAVAEEPCSAIRKHRRQTGMMTYYMTHLLLDFCGYTMRDRGWSLPV